MRILIVPSSYPPVLGGVQTTVEALAQHLIRMGNEVRVVTNRYPRSLPAFEFRNGVPVDRWEFLTPDFGHLRRRRPDLFLASLILRPRTARRLDDLLRHWPADVVNVHFPDAQIPFVNDLRKRNSFRLVVTLHGHEIERWFKDTRAWKTARLVPGAENVLPALRRLTLILRQADAVTACSRYLLDKACHLEATVAEKGHPIHNGIALERFLDRTPFPHPRPYLLAFGRLTQKKGFDMLLDAFARVASHRPGLDLILAGDGEERNKLVERTQQLGLMSRVCFFGRATPEEVVRLANGSLFVVVPSREEPFGIAAVEALAAGKTVVATRVGGLQEFVVGATNQLVEPTVTGLLEGIEGWLSRGDKLAALGEQNRIRAAEFAWPKVVEQYLAVFSGKVSPTDGDGVDGDCNTPSLLDSRSSGLRA